jgi:hypothetical protein
VGTHGSTFAFILQLGVQRGAAIGECPMFPKKFEDWLNNMTSYKKEKKKKRKSCECTHELV